MKWINNCKNVKTNHNSEYIKEIINNNKGD